jgi:hypothetical protein
MRRYHIRAGATTTAGGVRRQGGTKVATGDHIDLWNDQNSRQKCGQ